MNLKKKKLTLEELKRKGQYNLKKCQAKHKHKFKYFISREGVDYYIDSFYCKCGFVQRWFEVKGKDKIEERVEK